MRFIPSKNKKEWDLFSVSNWKPGKFANYFKFSSIESHIESKYIHLDNLPFERNRREVK
jgi:hypothetical protein